MATQKRKFLAILIILAALCLSVFFGTAATAYASRSNQGTNTDGEWTGTTTSNNLITIGGSNNSNYPTNSDYNTTLSEQGWQNTGGVYGYSRHSDHNDVDVGTNYGWGIHANQGQDIGDNGYNNGVYYTITLSEADRVKANSGQLNISASSLNDRARGALDHYISLKLFFYNGETYLSEAKTQNKYGNGTGGEIRLSISNHLVPANTTSIRYYVSNWGGGTKRTFIGDMSCTLTDSTAPSVEKVTADKSGIVDVANNIAIAGDTVKYYVEFNEKISSVTNYGTAEIKTGDTVVASAAAGELITQNGKSKILYSFTLQDKQNEGKLSFSVNNLSVSDEAGNTFLQQVNSSADDNITYYPKRNITSNVTNLTFAGNGTTAQYMTQYTAKLTAAAGYDLPGAIAVTVGGSVLTGGYTYNSSTGEITVQGSQITGDIEIAAAGVPKQSAVTFDFQSGSSGTPSATATFDAAMPAVTPPTRKGYTFRGYFTQAGGNGNKYYDESGQSAKNCDFYENVTLYAHWEANTYTVTYNANKPSSASGNVEGVTANSSHTYDIAVSLTENGYTLTGWTFKGWSDTANGTVVYFDGASVSNLTATAGGTVTLHAVWQPETHTVSFDSAGGSFAINVTAAYDSDMPDVEPPTRKGYNFKGYFTLPGGEGTQYYDGEGNHLLKYTVDGNIKLYAHWTPVIYNIELYSEGEYVGAIEDVVYGAMYLPSSEDLSLTRENYNFIGWNLYDDQNWSMYSANTHYSAGLADADGETVVLYAAWLEKDRYTVSFDANGGVGAPAMTQAHEDETITLSDTVPTRKNYTFLGWALSADAQNAEIMPGDAFKMGSSVVTLYAVWKHNPSLSYDANGGAFDVTVEVSYPAAGSTVTVTALAPEREGYIFEGWSQDKNATTKTYEPGAQFGMTDTDVVLYAVWKTAQYTVTSTVADGYATVGLQAKYNFEETAVFSVTGAKPKVYINGQLAAAAENGQYSFSVTGDVHIFVADGTALYLIYSANGGTGAPVDNAAYHTEDTAVVSDAAPLRPGYTFIGWTTDAGAQDAQYSAGNTLTFASADIVLHAVWQANSYTVNYNANDGTGSMESGLFTYGTAKALSPNTFEKTGHTFIGWALAADGEVVYADEEQVSDLCTQGEITLYAVWERTVTEITFAAEDGTEVNLPILVAYGERLTSGNLVVPLREGYLFAGYYTEQNGMGEMIFDAQLGVIPDGAWNVNESALKLYPRWIPISYTVIYMDGQQQASEQNAVYGIQFALKSADELGIVAPDGYHFAGWSAVPSGQLAVYSDRQIIYDGLTQTDGDEVFLYAVFETDEKFSVVYNANGGANAPIDSNEYLAGEKVTISSIIPEKEGYIFGGWSFNPNSDSVAFPYQDGQFTVASADMPTGGMSLYAVWIAGNTLQSQIDELEKLADELSSAISALEKADGDFKTEIEALGTALKAAQDAIAALDDTYATDAALASAVKTLNDLLTQAQNNLQTKITQVQTNLDKAVKELNASISGNKTDIESKLKAVEDAYKEADAIIDGDIAELTEKDTELGNSISALDASYKAADLALQQAIETVQANLDKAVEELTESISGNKTDIEEKLAALDAACKAADTFINSEIAALKAGDTELADSVSALNTAYKAADEALWAGIRQVQTNLDALQQQLEETDNGLEAKLDSLKADNKQTAMIYTVVNIILGAAAVALIIALVVKSVKKRKAQ